MEYLFKDSVTRAIGDKSRLECSMKISARNALNGTIVEVIKGVTTAHVRIDVGGAVITSSITNEAVDDLGLKAGMTASAVIKSSDVMVAVE